MKIKMFKRMIIIELAVIAGASAIAFTESILTGVIVLISSLLITIISVIFVKNEDKEIVALSDYLYKICNNLDALDIRDNAEGEISILKNNIYKTTLKLRSQAELLAKDKIWLADSLADISHQLKTPITSMMVMTDLLAGDNLSPEKRKEFLQNIERELQKMQWLIVTLLKISKFDAGTISLKEEKVSLDELADDALNPFLIQMELKGINIKKEYSHSTIIGDYSWTLEAIENIIKNCIEHMEKDGLLTIKVKDNPIFSEFIIKDTGCGINPEDLPHIFERFYKGKNSSSESVGIGLALSKSIFNRENAKIDVRSTLNEGSTFIITFYKNVV